VRRKKNRKLSKEMRRRSASGEKNTYFFSELERDMSFPVLKQRGRSRLERRGGWLLYLHGGDTSKLVLSGVEGGKKGLTAPSEEQERRRET